MKPIAYEEHSALSPPSSPLLAHAHAQALDLEWPYLEAQLAAVYLYFANLALQQIDLNRAGDRLAEL